MTQETEPSEPTPDAITNPAAYVDHTIANSEALLADSIRQRADAIERRPGLYGGQEAANREADYQRTLAETHQRKSEQLAEAARKRLRDADAA